MIRLAALLMLLALWVPGRLLADDPKPGQSEPPLRLKKKARPEPPPARETKPPAQNQRPAGPKKAEPPRKEGEEPDTAGEDLEAKIKEIKGRISRNLQQSEDRLARKDASDGTQLLQKDIVSDLDRLMELMRRQQQQQQQQSSRSSAGQKGRRQSARNQGRRQNQRTSAASAGQQQNQSRGQQRSSSTPAGGGNSRGGMSKIADLYKDIWGHLPETMRQEMDEYAREQFMPKYSDLLKQYYATIAEKGRKKHDPQ